MNNTVSQSVAHLHLHVVPRTKGDGLRGFFWPRTKYADGEAAATTPRGCAPPSTERPECAAGGPQQVVPRLVDTCLGNAEVGKLRARRAAA